MPVVISLGKIGLAFRVGFFAATFGAACETGLSLGYSIAQYFGWQWGTFTGTTWVDTSTARWPTHSVPSASWVVCATAVAAIPVMVITKAGQ